MVNENNVASVHSNIKVVILVSVVFIIIASISTYSFLKNKTPIIETSTTTNALPFEPKKTDFGTTTPTDFPTNIPIEKGAEVNQSYGLNYDDKKQLTMVFLSTKTGKENYNKYLEFLQKENWSISNKYEGEKVSSLYAVKEGDEINITINWGTFSDPIKSQVSISILDK